MNVKSPKVSKARATVLKRSPWISFFNSGGCNGCSLEVLAATNPRYDMERFGCLLKPSARHADVLVVTGPMTRQSRERLRNVMCQMADDKKVIAVGSCAITGGPFRKASNIRGTVDSEIHVDMYVPGCPPRPEAILDGVLKLLGMKGTRGQVVETTELSEQSVSRLRGGGHDT